MDDAEATKILKRDAPALLTSERRERMLDEFERGGYHAGECHGAVSAPQTQSPLMLANRWASKLLFSESHLLRTRRSARLGP
jgi:hypothetical protein